MRNIKVSEICRTAASYATLTRGRSELLRTYIYLRSLPSSVPEFPFLEFFPYMATDTINAVEIKIRISSVEVVSVAERGRWARSAKCL